MSILLDNIIFLHLYIHMYNVYFETFILFLCVFIHIVIAGKQLTAQEVAEKMSRAIQERESKASKP
jgi:hypothetical protein